MAAGEEKPSLIIIDLNHHTVKPLTVIPKLKSKFKKETNIIGFLSHLQGELKMKAQEAGCDMVLPRSAFSQNLPQLLRRHATSETELAGILNSADSPVRQPARICGYPTVGSALLVAGAESRWPFVRAFEENEVGAELRRIYAEMRV